MTRRDGAVGGGARRLACLAALLTFVAAAEADPVEQVVVTGLRRPAPLAQLAGNTARLDAGAIDRIGAQHPAEALNRLPGVYIHRGNGQEHLTAIRSPVLTGGAGAGSFLYLEDGIPLRAAGFGNVNGLFESVTELADGIEVVRGPGSALYGSNAVHGLINVLLPGPGGGRSRLAEVSLGSYHRAAARALISRGGKGAGEALGLSLAHEDGYISEAGLDQQKASFVSERSFGESSLRLAVAGSTLNQETAGFITGRDAYKSRALARTNPNPEAYRDAKSLRASAALSRPGPAGGTVTLTPFARVTRMEFLQHFLPSKAVEKNGHWSLGFQSRYDWQQPDTGLISTGLDLDRSEGSLSEVQALPSFGTFPLGVHYDFDVTALVAAPFVHGEWQATPRLRATAEARYEWTRYDYDTHVPAGVYGRFVVPADRTDEFGTLTPAAGLTYQAAEGLTLYMRAARGARAPQVSDLYRLQTNQDAGGIESETLDSLEAGLRQSGARGHLSVAAFAMNKRHFFFRDADGFNVTNGKTRHWGIEADGELRLNAALSLGAAATYARHTYRFDRPVTVNATESIASGDDIDTAPRWLGGAQAVWAPSARMTAELNWTYVGAYYTDAANQYRYPGHSVFDLRGEWRLGADVSLLAALRNLADTDYAERADYSFGTERYFPGEGRALELRLRYER